MYIPLLGHWYWSQQNSLIWVNRRGEIIVHGYKQTSKRYKELWTPPLRNIRSPTEVHTILVLGLAGGGMLPALYERFPNATITAVEHDARMVAVAKKLHQPQLGPFPTIIIGDAYEVLHDLDRSFDCILIDLFFGMTLPSFVESHNFWEAIKQRLSPNGTAILNIAGASYRGTTASAVFATNKVKRVYDNTFILYA